MSNFESTVLRVLSTMRNEYGWEYVVITRDDVEEHLGQYLSNKEWEQVKQSSTWSQGLANFLDAMVMDFVSEAVVEAGISVD